MPRTGYLSRKYAESLCEFGDPVQLPLSGGWILRRRIPNTDLEDAMGIYPFMSCTDWTGLEDDVEGLCTSGLVSLTIVTDPFCPLSEGTLSSIFPDRTIHFKNHHINDLDSAGMDGVSRRARRYASRALKAVTVERIDDPADVVDEWIALYTHLIGRRGITDLRTFSPASHRAQAAVPGAVNFRASIDDEPVGMHIWFVQDGIAHSHLSAQNERGYELRAGYALKAASIEAFTGEIRWLNNAGGSGRPGEEDGISAFKKRWSSTTRPSYLCGRILNEDAYRELAASTGTADSGYFPAYRAGEFG